MLDKELLFFIARKTRLRASFASSTAKIAMQLGISQQSVSRKLRELKKAGLVEPNASPKGIDAKLTVQGISLVREHFMELKQLFEAKPVEKLEGKVKIGFGEGAYYVSQPQYAEQFIRLLGFRPFPGTLNLVVGEEQLSMFLSALEPIAVKGFETRQRSFGKITAFKVSVEGKQSSAIVFPERTSHPPNEIEVIAPIYLRGKFRLKEGSKASLRRESKN